jgi:hypothetical protein
VELRWKDSQCNNRVGETEKTHFDRLAPIYPILPEEERTRIRALPGTVVPEFLWESERWLYLTKENNLHIFHNFLIDRRNSLDDLEFQRGKGPEPHRARSQTLFPLPQKQEYEMDESKRTY